jgi:hypothetical protein
LPPFAVTNFAIGLMNGIRIFDAWRHCDRSKRV